MNRNYQKELDSLISKIKTQNPPPTLLLHSCCGPCSSYCLEYLSNFFSVTVFYYNPNITGKQEYEKRKEEQIRLIEQLPSKNPIYFKEGIYEPERFLSITKGMEHLPEGGERCYRCYELRQRETAWTAQKNNFDYFTTTLSVSPHKNAKKLNDIGEQLEQEYGVSYLPSDFKKKNGYKRSIELSKEYQLYRQNYCGCLYSRLKSESMPSKII